MAPKGRQRAEPKRASDKAGRLAGMGCLHADVGACVRLVLCCCGCKVDGSAHLEEAGAVRSQQPDPLANPCQVEAARKAGWV